MTKKEIFDTVKNHLLNQGEQSFKEVLIANHITHYYRYRDEHGNKCAIGCLIPDEEYSKRLEGNNIEEILTNKYFSINFKNTLMPHLHLLKQLQKIHDNFEPHDWKERLKYLAKAEGIPYD